MKKAIILYYSYSGNTKKVAEFLKGKLYSKFEAKCIALKPRDESKSFFGQCVRAFKKVEADIGRDYQFDLKDYDLVCFGTPVWAFGMAPAMRAYLNSSQGLDAKKVILFATYGSGVGKDKCLREMAEIVKNKGADEVRSLLVRQGEIKNDQVLNFKAQGLF